MRAAILSIRVGFDESKTDADAVAELLTKALGKGLGVELDGEDVEANGLVLDYLDIASDGHDAAEFFQGHVSGKK